MNKYEKAFNRGVREMTIKELRVLQEQLDKIKEIVNSSYYRKDRMTSYGADLIEDINTILEEE